MVPSPTTVGGLVTGNKERNPAARFRSEASYSHCTWRLKVPEKSVLGYIVSYFTPPKVVGTFRGDPEVFGRDGKKETYVPREILTER